MIQIEINFYNKKTEFIADEALVLVPKNIVFKAAETEDISEINAYVFEVSDEMKKYIFLNYPDLKSKFDTYDFSFIGGNNEN